MMNGHRVTVRLITLIALNAIIQVHAAPNASQKETATVVNASSTTSNTPQATLSPTDKENRIRTQFAPRNEVVISSELSAKISSMPLRDGDVFRLGQNLVTFDCALFQAQLTKSQAMLNTARQALVIQQRLAELNSAGALEVQQAQGRVGEGTADVAFMQATVNRCVIHAPFSGRISKRLAAAHQYVTPGTPLLGLLDTSELELQLIVPSHWLSSIKIGSRFQVQVDELGKTVSARVVRLGARIDPVSQTASLTGVVDGSPSGLLPGMGGWANFATAPARTK